MQITEKIVNDNIEVIPSKDIFVGVRELTGLSRHQLKISSSYLAGERDAGRVVAKRFSATLEHLISGNASCVWESKPLNRYTETTQALYDNLDRLSLQEFKQVLDTRIEQEVFYATITEIEEYDFEGYVYDFEVMGPHNYVAANMLVHNTACQKLIIEQIKKEGKRVMLAAPTGKAARRMTEVTGEAAQTIHRLLEWSPSEGGFVRNSSNPLEADLVIIDEASMLSLELADSLVAAIPRGCHLLFVGDTDQLPPIGAGKVLDDMIECGSIKTTHLTQIFRQAASSMIISNAHRINRGEAPWLSHKKAMDETGMTMIRDFFWMGAKNPEDTANMLLEIVTERLPSFYGFDPLREIQVLVPMRKGTVGLENVNTMLQNALNPNGYPVGLKGIKVGDKIIENQNNYNTGIMNGDIAILKEFNRADGLVTLSLEDGDRLVTTAVSDLESFTLAYAISIHKSQGSQFKCVVMPVVMQFWNMLDRSLIYTGVTRSEKMVVMMGEPRALFSSISKTGGRKRNTTLAMRINNPAESGELF